MEPCLPGGPRVPHLGCRAQVPVRGPADLGNVRETFAKFMRNGEPVVPVRAVTDETAEFAAEILHQYSPIALLSAGAEMTL